MLTKGAANTAHNSCTSSPTFLESIASLIATISSNMPGTRSAVPRAIAILARLHSTLGEKHVSEPNEGICSRCVISDVLRDRKGFGEERLRGVEPTRPGAQIACRDERIAPQSAASLSIDVRNVWWRGSAVRSPPVNRRKLSFRRSAIRSTDMAATRAAASSIASGKPSRR